MLFIVSSVRLCRWSLSLTPAENLAIGKIDDTIQSNPPLPTNRSTATAELERYQRAFSITRLDSSLLGSS